MTYEETDRLRALFKKIILPGLTNTNCESCTMVMKDVMDSQFPDIIVWSLAEYSHADYHICMMASRREFGQWISNKVEMKG